MGKSNLFQETFRCHFCTNRKMNVFYINGKIFIKVEPPYPPPPPAIPTLWPYIIHEQPHNSQSENIEQNNVRLC